MSTVKGLKRYPVHITIEVDDGRYWEIQRLVAGLTSGQLDLLYETLRDAFECSRYDRQIKGKYTVRKDDFK